jgi:hypothetical protein
LAKKDEWYYLPQLQLSVARLLLIYDTMNALRQTTVFALICLLGACAEEPLPPISVSDFVNDPNLLEAVMVRCAQDRSKTKYDLDCVNARDAANRMASTDREERRKELEAQSERKRKALRRTQQAATEARRRAEEARRQREKDEYLGLYETVPAEGGSALPATTGYVEPQPAQRADILQGNEPGASISPPQDEAPIEDRPPAPPTDINSIREELKRRQDSAG